MEDDANTFVSESDVTHFEEDDNAEENVGDEVDYDLDEEGE